MLTADVIELLKPESNGPLLVITVGNRLRSDDGVAPYIAEHAKRPKNGIIILDAGERPEDIVGKAIEVRPGRVVIIDAADFGGEPGEVRAIPEEFIPENPISTHRFPLRIISRLVTEDTGARDQGRGDGGRRSEGGGRGRRPEGGDRGRRTEEVGGQGRRHRG